MLAPPTELRSARLRLRRWTPADRPIFAAMNADPVVMEYFSSTLTRSASDAFVDRIEQHFQAEGYGLWAVEIDNTAAFAGYVGLWPAGFDAHFTPAVEVGWRLRSEVWGHGFATEAASLALDDGFGRLGLDEIVSFTAAINRPSRRVMEKLGMRHEPLDDFDHPAVAAPSPLRPHVLYRRAASDWVPDERSRLAQA
jgi:RimJ/RimL family protein N-acetyltransferase